MALHPFDRLWECLRDERTAVGRCSLAVLFAIGWHLPSANDVVQQRGPSPVFVDLAEFESVMLDSQILESIRRFGFVLRRLPCEPSRQTSIQHETKVSGVTYSFKKHQDFALVKVTVREELQELGVVEDHAFLNLGGFARSAEAALNGLQDNAQSGTCTCFYAEAHEAPYQPVLSSIRGNGLDSLAARDVEFQTSKFTFCKSKFGSPFSASSPRVGLHSMQLVRAGAPRLCIVISPNSRHALIECLKSSTTSPFMCSQAVEHQTVWPSPAWLEEHDIQYQITWQEAGEVLILAPEAYLYGMNTGSHVLETLHYATADWSSAATELGGYQFCRGSCSNSVGYFDRNSTVSFKIVTSVTDNDREREAARILAEHENTVQAQDALESPSQQDTRNVPATRTYIPPVTRSTLLSHLSTDPNPPAATLPIEEAQLPPLGSNQSKKRGRPPSTPTPSASESSRTTSIDAPPSQSSARSSTFAERQGATHTRLYYYQERDEVAGLMANAGIQVPPKFQLTHDADDAGNPKRQCRSLPTQDFVQLVIDTIEEGLRTVKSTVEHYTEVKVDPGFGRKWTSTERLNIAAKFESQSDVGKIMAYFQYYRVYKDSRIPVGSQSNRAKCLLFGTLVDRCSTGVLLLFKASYSTRTYTRVGQPAIDAAVEAIERRNYDYQARLLEPLSSAILSRRPRPEVLRLSAEWQERRSGRLLNFDKLKS